MKVRSGWVCLAILTMAGLSFSNLVFAYGWIETHVQSWQGSRFQIEAPSSSSGFRFDGCVGGAKAPAKFWKGKHCNIAMKKDTKSFVIFKISTLEGSPKPGSCDLALKVGTYSDGSLIEYIYGLTCQGSFSDIQLYPNVLGLDYTLSFADGSAPVMVRNRH